MTRLIIILGTGFVAGLIAFNTMFHTEQAGWIGFGLGVAFATFYTQRT